MDTNKYFIPKKCVLLLYLQISNNYMGCMAAQAARHSHSRVGVVFSFPPSVEVLQSFLFHFSPSVKLFYSLGSRELKTAFLMIKEK